MSTEYITRYEKPSPLEVDKNHASLGPKEGSGFVANKEMEDTLTGTPGERWLIRDRQTGTSIYQDKYVPYAYAKVSPKVYLSDGWLMKTVSKSSRGYSVYVKNILTV